MTIKSLSDDDYWPLALILKKNNRFAHASLPAIHHLRRHPHRLNIGKRSLRPHHGPQLALFHRLT